MMHGAKKSHSSIVPAKPANKAEQSAAESVEGDAGTKRNRELQSTVRTQGRNSPTRFDNSNSGAPMITGKKIANGSRGTGRGKAPMRKVPLMAALQATAIQSE